MANNYSEMSIAFPVTEGQGNWLLAAGEALGTVGEDGASEPPEGLTLEDMDYPPCVLEIEPQDNGQFRAWMYTEESVDTEVLTSVLQQFLKHFDLEMGIGIEMAFICSKPLIGEFGGAAAWVTKDGVEWMSTQNWLAEKERTHGMSRRDDVAVDRQALRRLLERVGFNPASGASGLRAQVFAADQLVTCDHCLAVSESGWGDTPLCVDCQRKADPALVCEAHQLTHEIGELCPACKVAPTALGVCEAHGVTGLCPEDGVVYEGPPSASV